MIHSFKAANFYSIGKGIEVNFTVNKKASSKRSYADILGSDERVSLIESMVGANASGKTNALKVLPFMKWIIVDAYMTDPDHELPVRPFGHKESDSPSSMSAVFSVGGRLFSYEFKLTRDRILFEKLAERSETTERITNKTLFSRAWDESVQQYKVKDKAFGIVDESRNRKNCSIVSVAFRAENELATTIVQYWRDGVNGNIYEKGYRYFHHMSLDQMTQRTLEQFHKNPELQQRLEDILCKYDIGFEAFKKYGERETTSFAMEHVYGDRNVEIPLEYESSGTKHLIVILNYVLGALSVEGGIAVIDELDSNLHPEIVEDIVSMFADPEVNPNNSQIIFSSHTPSILATLDKYQIILVEKDEKGETETWRLDEIKGVRADDNYYTKYMAGAYGAVPSIG